MTVTPMPGDIFRHAKGNLYVVERVVTNATNGPADQQKMVLYRRAVGSLSVPEGMDQWFVREIGQFMERFSLIAGYEGAEDA